MNPAYSLFPLLILLLWIGAVVYAFMLATRLVQAVEWIARSLAQRPLDRRDS